MLQELQRKDVWGREVVKPTVLARGLGFQRRHLRTTAVCISCIDSSPASDSNALLPKAFELIQRTNRYSVGEMLLALLYPMLLGLDRIETTQLLRQNGVFQYLTGLPSYPNGPGVR